MIDKRSEAAWILVARIARHRAASRRLGAS